MVFRCTSLFIRDRELQYRVQYELFVLLKVSVVTQLGTCFCFLTDLDIPHETRFAIIRQAPFSLLRHLSSTYGKKERINNNTIYTFLRLLRHSVHLDI